VAIDRGIVSFGWASWLHPAVEIGVSDGRTVLRSLMVSEAITDSHRRD